MPYAVLIASQRSGTTALTSLVSGALGINCTGEILDPSSRSFAINEAEGIPTWPRVKTTLQGLHTSDQFSLIDVKINSLGSVIDPWRSFVLRPALFDLFAADKAKIIWLQRPAAEQWVSGQLAIQTKVWHYFTPNETKASPVHVNPVELEKFLATRAKEDRLLETWLKDFSVLELSYDETLGPNADENVLPRISKFLGIDLVDGWQTVRPTTHKFANIQLEDNIANLDEVRHLLPFKKPQSNAAPNSERLLNLLQLPDSMQTRVRRRENDLKIFEKSGVLEQRHFQNRVVLDWECGDAAFGIAFGLGGASHVYAADSWLNIDLVSEPLKHASNIQLRLGEIRHYAAELRNEVDLVFANTVTEHLQDLPTDFAEVYRLLRSGGHLFINHDNYYQPVGSHDHGLLFYGTKEIEPQGPKCWETIGKCKDSENYRKSLKQRLPWTWDSRNEINLDPKNCEACHYFKRSQPWAHLIYQNEFANLFPQEGFSTGKPRSSLNKLTIFQVRQLIIEAGFVIEKEHFATISNEPPKTLLDGPLHFSKFDLQTPMYRVLARKP